MDKPSETRLTQVHPLLAETIRQLSDSLNVEGIEFRVTQGLRTWAEQDALYQQGRTTPGNIITKCPAGYSWHNFGMAVDLAPDNPKLPGYQPDWDLTHPAWKRLVEMGEHLGLVAGAEWRTFPDWPHFQLTGRFPTSPDDEVRQLFKDGGMQAVWGESGLTIVDKAHA